MNKKIKYIVAIIIIITLIFIIPVVINESYKIGGYTTLWGAEDVLMFYGTILSFLGTSILGVIAIKQSSLANDLAKRMLEKEESDNMPLVDVTNVNKDLDSILSELLARIYKVQINSSFFYFKTNNQLSDDSDYVDLFVIRNVSNTNIISFRIIKIEQSTLFLNGKRIKTNIKEYETSLPITIMKSETHYLGISGIETNKPEELSQDERFEQGYYQEQTEIVLTLELINDKGIKYNETIKVVFSNWLRSGNITSPLITEKEIVEIKKL